MSRPRFLDIRERLCPVDPPCPEAHEHVVLVLNRERRKVLAAVDREQVAHSGGGNGGIYLRPTNFRGTPGRIDGTIEAMKIAGWVCLASDRCTYELTAVGRALLLDSC